MIKKVLYSNNFKKSFKSKIAKNRKSLKDFKQKWELFINNPNDPRLKNHRLSGKLKGYNAISIQYNLRLIYKDIDTKTIVAYDIGTHEAVYK